MCQKFKLARTSAKQKLLQVTNIDKLRIPTTYVKMLFTKGVFTDVYVLLYSIMLSLKLW